MMPPARLVLVLQQRHDLGGRRHLRERARGLGRRHLAQDVDGDVVLHVVEHLRQRRARHLLDDLLAQVLVQVLEQVADALGGEQREHRLALVLVQALEEVGLVRRVHGSEGLHGGVDVVAVQEVLYAAGLDGAFLLGGHG